MHEKIVIDYSSDEDVEAPLTGSARRSPHINNYCRSCSALRSVTAVLLSLIAITSSLTLYLSLRTPSEQECTARVSAYSPLLDAVEYSEFNFNNSFMHRSIYRGPPTNEIEAAWERLWNHDLVAIPEDKFMLLNKPAEGSYKRVPPEKGGGYAANIEVFHHLHCLSLIRQMTWLPYYSKHPDRVSTPYDMTDTDVGLRIHVDHCIETLRLSLMCHSDVTPYLMIYDGPDDELGEADFNAHHKCRNFDRVRETMIERAVIERWPGGNRMWTKGEDD